MDPYSLDHIVLPSSFAKIVKIVGPTRVELVTSSLSEKRSNQLSYDPGVSEWGNPIAWNGSRPYVNQ